MSPRDVAAFRLDEDMNWGLQFLKARDGLPVSEQVRRAITQWLRQQNADQRTVHRAFDDFETGMTAADNRQDGSLADLRLPKAFGDRLAGRRFGTLSESEMTAIEALAAAAKRGTKAHRLFWRRAVSQAKK